MLLFQGAGIVAHQGADHGESPVQWREGRERAGAVGLAEIDDSKLAEHLIFEIGRVIAVNE